jgi:putative membrane protein
VLFVVRNITKKLTMKKVNLILTIALSAFMLQACNNAGKDSTEKADSLNAEKDTSVAGPGIAVVEDDSKFVVDAGNGGMTEVELSKLAQQKATNAKAKEFADMMVMDHTKANEELKALAKAKNITLPDSLNADSKKTWDDLNGKTGKDFDKAYTTTMVTEHKKTVAMFESASKDLKDAELKAFVDKTLPVLKGHLDKINAINDGIK